MESAGHLFSSVVICLSVCANVEFVADCVSLLISCLSLLQDLVENRFGVGFKLFCEILILVYLMGLCVVFLAIIGDTITPSVQHWLGVGHVYTRYVREKRFG